MAKKTGTTEAAPKKRRSATHKMEDLKLMSYNGVQMSRKMFKLWDLDKILRAGPGPKSTPKA